MPESTSNPSPEGSSPSPSDTMEGYSDPTAPAEGIEEPSGIQEEPLQKGGDSPPVDPPPGGGGTGG